jgi:hypothetical protein
MIKELFSRNPHLLFYTILAGSVLVIRIPVIGRYFRTVNTLLHESGHAIAAILTSGEVMSIELSSDTSGSANTKSRSKLKAMFVSFAGYPVAALSSGILLAFATSQQPKTVFFLLLSVALLNLALFVRNFYGIVWLFSFSGLILFVFWLGDVTLSYIFTLAVSLISFSETVFSTLIILYLSFSQPKKAGDTTNLARASGIPAAFWGLLITALVSWIVWLTVARYFPFPLKPLV